jgi:hypothetical protein
VKSPSDASQYLELSSSSAHLYSLLKKQELKMMAIDDIDACFWSSTRSRYDMSTSDIQKTSKDNIKEDFDLLYPNLSALRSKSYAIHANLIKDVSFT